jgi:hypothetical protein
VLVSNQVAADFDVAPGDALNVTIFPDEKDRVRNVTLRVAGVFRSFPPTDPSAGLVTTTTAVQPLRAPDYYLPGWHPATPPRKRPPTLVNVPAGSPSRPSTGTSSRSNGA